MVKAKRGHGQPEAHLHHRIPVGEFRFLRVDGFVLAHCAHLIVILDVRRPCSRAWQAGLQPVRLVARPIRQRLRVSRGARECVAATNVVRIVSCAFVGLEKTSGLTGLVGNRLEKVSAALRGDSPGSGQHDKFR